MAAKFSPLEFRATVKEKRSWCVLSSDKLQAVCALDEVRTALRKCLVPETRAEPVAA